MAKVRREEVLFLHKAPVPFVVEHHFAASPERVFDALADAPGWSDWLSISRRVLWTSSEEGGIGSTRQVVLYGGVAIDEEFIVWERPWRWGFQLTGSNVPVFRAGVELAELHPAAGGGTQLRYQGGVELVAGLRPFQGLVTMILPKLVNHGLGRLSRLLGDHP